MSQPINDYERIEQEQREIAQRQRERRLCESCVHGVVADDKLVRDCSTDPVTHESTVLNSYGYVGVSYPYCQKFQYDESRWKD